MTEPVHDTRLEHAEFYANPVIAQLAHEERWSISDNTKTPINVVRLLKEDGALRGAHALTPECLMPLAEMMEALPNAANNAFHLRAQVDGYAVLDIEPTCPPELLPALLSLPNLWVERSMSGKGYHLLMPLPQNFSDYPVAAGKVALKHPDKHYEILLEHWVTFTRQPVPFKELPVRKAHHGSWEDLYASLAKDAVATPVVDVDISSQCPGIEHMDTIIRGMLEVKRKAASAFKDPSAYHFSVLSSLQFGMDRRIGMLRMAYPDLQYTDNQKVWLLYTALVQIVPHRSKHETLRGGMPLLFDRARWAFSRTMADDLNDDREHTP